MLELCLFTDVRIFAASVVDPVDLHHMICIECQAKLNPTMRLLDFTLTPL